MKSGAKKTLARCGLGATLATGLVCALPTLAFAAEEESSGGISAILPDMNEFVAMLVAFILVLIVLAKFGWPIFENIIVKRETTIKDNLTQAEEARAESERVLEEYREQLAQARQEANSIIAEAKQNGETVRAELKAKAEAEAADIVAKGHQTVEIEKKTAMADLQGSVVDLTIAVTSKIVGEDFSDEDHRALIERSLAKAGALDA